MATRHPEQLRTAINWGMHHQFDGVTYSGLADAAMDAIPDGWAKVDGAWVQVEAQRIGKDGERVEPRVLVVKGP